jgi:hypothetical protein
MHRFQAQLEVKQLLGPRLVCLQAHGCNPQSLMITGSPDPAVPAVTGLTLVPSKLNQGYQLARRPGMNLSI